MHGSDKIFPVSWDIFHRDARALAWRLASIGGFSAIVAVTRGGLVPAAIVARELGIPAVVGCGDATVRLRTGDRVQVDGAAGRVTVLARCTNHAATAELLPS